MSAAASAQVVYRDIGQGEISPAIDRLSLGIVSQLGHIPEGHTRLGLSCNIYAAVAELQVFRFHLEYLGGHLGELVAGIFGRLF